ncbi:MAG: hypothetical protein KDA75_12720 [Planctomycetaceae bacterium]|nr:hypothetical protein [Planctomycetaceae bacterium]
MDGGLILFLSDGGPSTHAFLKMDGEHHAHRFSKSAQLPGIHPAASGKDCRFHCGSGKPAGKKRVEGNWHAG